MRSPKGYFRSAGSTTVGAFTCWFEATGEFREPKPGEFYLSGAIPGVWQMPERLPASGKYPPVNDYGPTPTTPTPSAKPLEFRIMRQVKDPPVYVEKNGWRYRLCGSVNEKG